MRERVQIARMVNEKDGAVEVASSWRLTHPYCKL